MIRNSSITNKVIIYFAIGPKGPRYHFLSAMRLFQYKMKRVQRRVTRATKKYREGQCIVGYVNPCLDCFGVEDWLFLFLFSLQTETLEKLTAPLRDLVSTRALSTRLQAPCHTSRLKRFAVIIILFTTNAQKWFGRTMSGYHYNTFVLFCPQRRFLHILGVFCAN